MDWWYSNKTPLLVFKEVNNNSRNCKRRGTLFILWLSYKYLLHYIWLAVLLWKLKVTISKTKFLSFYQSLIQSIKFLAQWKQFVRLIYCFSSLSRHYKIFMEFFCAFFTYLCTQFNPNLQLYKFTRTAHASFSSSH